MKTQSKEWILKYISVGAIVLTWLIVWWWNHGHPESSTSIPIGIGTILTLVSLLFAFGGKIKSFLPKEIESIASLTEERIMEIIEVEAGNKWNNIKVDNPYEWKRTDTVNQNIIVTRKVNMNLDNEQFIIVLNATYPNVEPSVYPPKREDAKGKMVSVDKDDYYIDKLINKKSINPNAEPTTEKYKEYVDPFGKPVREVEKTMPQQKEKEENPVA